MTFIGVCNRRNFIDLETIEFEIIEFKKDQT
jgi:hypothetical protein